MLQMGAVVHILLWIVLQDIPQGLETSLGQVTADTSQHSNRKEGNSAVAENSTSA